MKLRTLKSLVAAALAAVGLNANSAQVEYTDPIGDTTSEACVDATSGAKDNANQFANDLSASNGKNYDLVQLGDSVTENWGSTGVEGAYSKLKIGLDANYPDGVICMGIGGNRTQNIIYRCHNGTLDNYKTKYFTVLCGVNNIYQRIIDSGEDPDDPKDVAEAIRIILNCILEKHEESKILLMPILPYAYTYNKNGSYMSLYRKGLRVRENTEEVNDIIMKFIDNKRVFWLDVRKDFVTEYGLPDFTKFGGAGGSYDPDQCLHPNTYFAYQYFNEAVTNAMHKYWNVAAGTAQCTDPSLGLVTSEQKGFSTNETINISGIYLGTDSSATRVTSYSVAYELDGGARVTALTNQSATRNSFDVPCTTLGEHTIVVYVTTAAGVTVSRTLKFIRYDGWMAEALGTDESQVRTNGTLKYAYALNGNYTINTVPFTMTTANKIDDDNIYWSVGTAGSGGSPDGVEDGDYKKMLKNCWWATAGKREVTLRNLTPGNQYLVQIFGCRNVDATDGNVFIDESFQEKYTGGNFIKVRGTGWGCGGTLIGCFTADSTGTKAFNVCSDGNNGLNAIQVRDLGATGYIPVSVVNPSISSASASVDGATATVSLSGIAMGTDAEGTAATSYSVAYALDGADAVTVATGLTGTSYSFTLTDLADATYSCVVTVTTDAGKTATKTVSFTVDNVPDPVSPSLAAAATVSGSNVTVAVSSIVLGTDSDCDAATSYTLTYALNGADAVTVLENATATSTSFTLSNLEEGTYSCVLTMTTDKATVATKTVSFTVSSSTSGGGSVIPSSEGWTVSAPEDTDGLLCTTGTLVYAYAPAELTVGGVSFTADQTPSSADFAFSITPTTYDSASGSADLSGDWASLMKQSWRWNSVIWDMTLTLNGLTEGKLYLVQLIAHNKWSDGVSIGAGDADKVAINTGLGASLVGIFTATGTSQTFTLTFSGGGPRAINAVQVRLLGEGGTSGGGEEEEEKEEDDPADPVVVDYCTLTIPAADAAAANLTLSAVKTNGVNVAAVSEGVYSIVSNTEASVYFTANSGYKITGTNPVVVTMDDNVTFSAFPTTEEYSGKVWPTGVPCNPQNRATITTDEAALELITQLYSNMYNAVHTSTKKHFNLITIGDSITDNWSYRDPTGYYALGENVVNFGIKGDRTEHVLWRLEEGGLLDNTYTTDFFTLLIGTNNSFQRLEDGSAFDDPEEIATGIERMIYDIETTHPEAKIILMPILPYQYIGNSRSAACRANNENVNDLIIKFVDNKRVFWLDLRGGFLNADGSFIDEYFSPYASGGDGQGHYLHPTKEGYVAVFDPAVSNAMEKYSAIAVGTAQETDPSIAYASASVDGVAQKVTMSIPGIYVGTDSSAVAATSYDIAYKLDDADWVTVLEDQTLTRNTIEVPCTTVGEHSCQIRVTTSAGKTATVTSEFTMCDAWSAQHLTGNGDSICTNGTLLCAYALNACTANGVPFAKLESKENTYLILTNFSLSATSGSTTLPSGVSGGYYTMLQYCWWYNTGVVGLNLRNLEVGEKYLVQLVAYRYDTTYNKGKISIVGTQQDVTYIKGGGDDWETGGTLVGTFTADATTKDFVVSGDNTWMLNAIQIRHLGKDEEYNPPSEDPEEEDDPVVPVYTLTIPTADNMTLSGVSTNGHDVAATSGNQYSIVSNIEVKVSFTAADGYEFTGNDYVTVTVISDMTLSTFPAVSAKGGEEDDPVTPMEEGWTAIAMTANGSSVCTTGNLVYAYAMYDVTVNGVKFTGVGTGGINNDDCVTAFTSGNTSTTPPSDTAAGDYTKLLQYGWWKNVKDRDFVLNNLTAGKQYLVQLIGFRSDYTTGYGYISSYSDQHMRFGGTGYEYGGSLIGVFTATASSETITVSYNTQCYLNAIQVREIVASEPEEETGFTDWPTDPDTEITSETTPADLGITAGDFVDAGYEELRKFSKWAKDNGVAFDAEGKNELSFDDQGNPENDFTKAYLLNCAESDVETEEPKFKFAAITPGVVPSIDDSGYNGEAKVEGSAKLGTEASWEDADASKHYFFRARLIRKAE